jgi:hypothetical protein
MLRRPGLATLVQPTHGLKVESVHSIFECAAMRESYHEFTNEVAALAPGSDGRIRQRREFGIPEREGHWPPSRCG